ncbi:MAG: PAS domain S-box protein [Bacteroidales bacterium]
MSDLNSNAKLIQINIVVALIYLGAAALSFIVGWGQFYLHNFWFAFAISAGIVYVKGKSVLPGIIFASILAHTVLALHSASNLNVTFPFATLILLPVFELLLLYLLNHAKETWIKQSYSEQRIRLNFLLFISFILPIPIASVVFLFLYQLGIASPMLVNALSVYFGFVLTILVFTPLHSVWANFSEEKTFFNLNTTIKFSVFSLVALSGVLVRLNPSFDDVTRTYLIAIPFVYILYVSLNYSYRVQAVTLAVFNLIFIAVNSSLYGGLSNSLFDILYLVIIALISHYIKDRYDAGRYKISTLKSDYKYVEDEINRQVKEYKNLNTKLLEEIEKRGIAERELASSKNLLAEAQDIGNISTWEYSFEKNRFRWISHNPQTFLLNFNLEAATFDVISENTHPDDTERITEIRRLILRQKESFVFEVRLKRLDESYGYFLIRGKCVLSHGKIIRVLGLIMDITQRKLAEQVLIENEQKYKALFSSNIDPVCVIDASTYKISDVNPAFETVYGFNSSELIGESYLNLSVEPNDTKAAIAFCKQKGSYRVAQRKHRNKAGDVFLIEANLMSYATEEREMIFIITHDITRRKESERKLAEREQKFRAFFESDLIGMAEISIAKEWLGFNEKLTQMLGYSDKELKAKSWDDITHFEDLPNEQKLFNQVLTHERDGYTLEKRLISKKSEVIQCKVTLKSIKTLQGTISHLVILVDDISDMKRAEKELLESRTKLSQAQSVARLGSIRFYPGVNDIALSEEAYEILGYGIKRPSITRKDFFKIILPGSNTRFEQLICDLEQGVEVKGDYEQAVITHNGDVKYILVNFGLTTNRYNQVVEVLITMADITRIKKAEMALQEANVLKDQLFSIIGHDLKSPIGSINQLVNLYIDGLEEHDDETSKSVLQTLKITSEETYKLLENLLDWAKTQRTDSYKPEKTNLVALVEQVLALTKGAAEAKNITVQQHLIDSAYVIIDVDMIKTVLRNLISNSIKFTPNSGAISIGITENGNDFLVSVSDTGVGIPAETLPNLLDNTKNFSTLGTNNEKGTGLGLKLSKKFIEKHGGQLFIESQIGQGSKFSFTIPKLIDS